jgi:hypothetical protein
MSAAQKLARSLVVMKAAGGAIDDIIELAKAHGVRAVHVQQLDVPPEEAGAQRMLVEALRPRIHSGTKSTGRVNCWDCRMTYYGESYDDTLDKPRPPHPHDK